jgi:hypothetical protein
LIKNGCSDHALEFGKCTGVVIGPVDYGSQLGPEVDVRWWPSNLRYSYQIDELVDCEKELKKFSIIYCKILILALLILLFGIIFHVKVIMYFSLLIGFALGLWLWVFFFK